MDVKPNKLQLEFDRQSELFTRSVDASIKGFLINVENYVNKQAILGLTDEQIVQNLEEQIASETGIFQVLKDEVGKIFSQSVSMVSGGVFNATIANKPQKNDMREWITVFSGNESSKHCDTCLERHKDVKSLAEWKQIGTPDNPFFDVHLSFNVPCYCLLVPIEISSKAGDLLEPITLD